ncbi:MAG: translocation/assembly module TamB domain-containing protein [Bacteroidales bacterium]|jgi:hypothetical protein|nr:translocation/assembly module TamB domain-containing protein [Bacteroidales bacterium]
MGKNIKKRWIIAITLCLLLVFIPVTLWFLLKSPAVQTYLVNRMTSSLSEKIEFPISVGKIHFSFFNKITAEKILILDHNNDTLLFAGNVNAGIRRFSVKNRIVHLSRITVQDPVVKFITDTTGYTNLNQLLSKIIKPPELRDSAKTNVRINQIEVVGGRFTLRNDLRSNPAAENAVNFSDLVLSDINAIIEDFTFENDTTSMLVYRASFRERSGFQASRFAGRLSVTRDLILFSDVELMSDESFITGDLVSLSHQTADAFRNFAEEVRMSIILNRSVISPNDLYRFLPRLNLISGPLFLSGRLSGPVSQLRGRNFIIEGGDITKIECDFDFTGLPDFDNTYLFVDIGNLTTRLSEITRLGLINEDKLPETIDRELGIINFKGTFAGFTTDFVTYGRLQTEAGALSTDISFRPSDNNNFYYKGSIQGTEIEAGRLSGQNDLLGKATFHLEIDGFSRSVKDFDATLKGTVEKAEINSYIYRDMELNGFFTEKRWDGTVNVRDENIILDFNGILDFQSQVPEYNFTLSIPYSNLYNLNFDKTDPTSTVNIAVTANFKGSNIDNLSGEINLHNSAVSRKGKTLDISSGSLVTRIDEQGQSMDITSDFADMSIRGEYNFNSLSHSFKTILAGLLPSRFEIPTTIKDPDVTNRFIVNLEIRETEALNHFLGTGLDIAPGSKASLKYGIDSMITAEASFDHLSYKNTLMNRVMFGATIRDSISEISLNSDLLSLAGRADLENFRILMETVPDTITLNTQWDNRESVLNKGSLSLLTRFSKEADVKNASVSVRQSDLWVKGDNWRINPARLEFSNRKAAIDNLYVYSEDDFYRVNGIVSESRDDTLLLDFEGINLASLNSMFENKGTEDFRITVEGILSGKVLLTGLLGEMMLETDNVKVEDFRMIDHEYGDLFLNSIWDNKKRVAEIGIYSELNNVRALDISGSYNPEQKHLELTALVKKLPVDILNTFLTSFASGIRGFATGKINLEGKINQPVITGSLFIDEGTMKIDYLQTQYFFRDSIRFDKRGIVFNNISVADDRGNLARLNGLVRHSYFRNYEADLTLSPNQVKVLDTRPKDNDMFYGTAYATGVVAIRSSGNSMAFEISARTDRNTRFIVPFTSSQSIGEYSFVTFTGSDIPPDQNEKQAIDEQNESPESISLNFDLDVTPDAEVQLVLDAKAGDVMRGRGSGKLNISLTPKGDFNISGDYIISSGEYLFTLGNIFNKRFNVDEGSRLSWNGSLTDADIDISARYRLETSLYDLLRDERFRDRIPVECLLHMTGRLMNPNIAFDITLPTADEQTRSYLRNAINTEEELIRQFAYLLMMGMFYPDPAFRSGTESGLTSGAGISAIGNTMEMFSNQLTNWLSQISNDFDLGFVYRPGNEISAQEVEMAFSTQLMNDRVSINGNFDVGAGQGASTATTVTGAFDVVVSITERLKFKFFNRSNDNIFYETAPYTQGIGIFFRHDFDRFRNLFRRKNRDNSGTVE